MLGDREVGQDELIAAAEAFQEALAPGDGSREVVVMGRLDRTLLSWSTLQGSALLLAASPDSLVGSALWARPTLFCGNAAELAAFRHAVEQEKPPFWARKKDRLPFGRLRTVIWMEGVPSDEERGFWEGRGVRVSRMP